MTKRKRASQKPRKVQSAKGNYCIVKRAGHEVPYDERKVYGSAYFAARNAHLHEKQAEAIAEKVCTSVNAWIKKHKTVSSDAIFKHITNELKKYNKDAAFLYKTHRDIC